MLNRVPHGDENLVPFDAGGAPPSQVSDFIVLATEILRRRILTLLLVSGLVFLVGIGLILRITPLYETTARLRIDPTRSPTVNPRNTNADLSDEAIVTEVTLMRSPDVAKDVIKRLGLLDDPEFRTAQSGRPIDPQVRLDRAAEHLLAQLDVGREKLTYVINIRYRSKDPQVAANVANAIAEAYIKRRVGGLTGSAQVQADFFGKRAEELDQEVRAADARVAAFRAQAGLVAGGANGTITDQQVAPLSGEVAQAESEAAEARAALAEAQRQIATGGIDAVSAVRSSTVIADLRRQLAEVTRNQGEINARYLGKYPEAIKVKQQIAELNAQIDQEARRAIGELRAKADTSAARAASLRASLSQLKSEQATNTKAAAAADALEREALGKREALKDAEASRQQALQSASNNIANAELVELAEPPQWPSVPNRRLLAVVAFVIAIAAGIGVVAGQELLSTGIRTFGDVDRQLQLPLIAAVPKLGAKNGKPVDMVISQPGSLYVEALRNIRASIFGVGSSGQPQTIALTSALPDEGKSTLALSFSRLLARNNENILLIECDVRRGRLLHQTDGTTKAGLMEVLSGNARLSDAIVVDPMSGLNMLLLKERVFTAEEIFAGSAFSTLLTQARGHYKSIILDLPPIMGLADARSLAALADGTILVVRWGATPRRAAQMAVERLRSDGANILGTVLTMADPNSEIMGGVFYSKKYSSYYQDS